MIQFNSDGSLKLPGNVAENKEANLQRMKNTRCIHIKKEIVSFTSPKKCKLKLKLSDRITDNRFVETSYNYFLDGSEVPSKLNKINEKEFEVEIGTCFRRCTDCCSLVNRFRDFMDGCVIEEKAGCTFEPNRNFSYEDYFD